MDGQIAGRPKKNPRFPSFPSATDPVTINKVLQDHFFRPKKPLLSRTPLTQDPSTVPLSTNELRLAPSKFSPSSAPGPDVIPYSVWKKINLINPTIILELLSPLVAFGYHPPRTKNCQRGGPEPAREGLL